MDINHILANISPIIMIVFIFLLVYCNSTSYYNKNNLKDCMFNIFFDIIYFILHIYI